MSRQRAVYATGFAALVATLAVFAVLRWPAPLVTVGALGVPLLYALHLYRVGAQYRRLVLIAAFGVALGVGWALASAGLVADSYDAALGPGTSRARIVLSTVAVAVVSAVVMLLPVVAARLAWRAPRKCLDGFTFGAAGALSVGAALTLSRLVPQFATGLAADDWPVGVLLIQAAVQGVALPITVAAIGGLVGAALWSGRRPAVAFSLVVVLTVSVAIGLLDSAAWAAGPLLVGYLAVAVGAVVALRAGGVSLGAAPGGTPLAWLMPRLGAGVAVVAAAGMAAAALLAPAPPRYVCPPDCGPAPLAEPLESNPRFVSADGAFSVQYPGPGSAYEVRLDPDGVELEFVGGDTGILQLFGMPAEGRGAEKLVEELLAEHFPDAEIDYEIPNAMVGYQPGYGVVVDEYSPDSATAFTRLRLIVMAAVRDDYALVAAAIGPYHEFSREFGNGHPSAANLQLALDMGKYVNSFRWR